MSTPPDPNHSLNSNNLSDASSKARDRAIKEALTPLDKLEALRLRACCDENLDHAAVRLLILITTLMWLKDAGGFYRGQLGTLAITSRRLARLMHAGAKGFWSRPVAKKKIGADGKPLRVEKLNKQGQSVWRYVWEKTGRLCKGWIEQLVNGNYIWIGKHRIKNIQEERWLNVYHVCVFSPRQVEGDPDGWEAENWNPESAIADVVSAAVDDPQTTGRTTQPVEADQAGNGEAGAAQGGGGVPHNRAATHGTTGPVVSHNRAATHGTTGPVVSHNRAATHSTTGPATHSTTGPTPITQPGQHPPDDRPATQGTTGPVVPGVLNKESGERVERLERVDPGNRLDTGTRLRTRAGAAEGDDTPRLPVREEGDEADFMKFCHALFGTAEMKKSGGIWRTRFREYPAKAWGCVQEGKETRDNRPKTIRKSLAAYVTDLYKKDRLAFGKPPARRLP